ncbi:Hint domain-containing protein [Nioella sp. MMSF_3534]|uniref:Hint domain-containing protein n=1 Tax=Nioella sp. MMSF_3534 TaxID=3046720 RepID=UPI00273E15B9|nr:Hint domain-containing protein [Nioella sp. MMSF_3534]
MPTYDISGYALYQVDTSNNNSLFQGTTVQNFTFNDFEGDSTYEIGDVLGVVSGNNLNYLGNMSVPLVGGGSMELALVQGAGTFVDPNVIEVLIVVPSGMSVTDFIFPNPIDYSARETDAFLTCFAAGSQISTPEGERAIETLRIGDLIETANGAVPVKWIGRQTVSTRFGPAERLMPVRFAAGALGPNVPHTDLTVTADHGMLVEGVICHAGALVNGVTITRVPLAEMGESYTVYHIETEEHEIILANGAPAETFIDNVSRRVFDNYAEFEALYGDVPEMEELPYPRAMSARQVPAYVLEPLRVGSA